jgi:hypothetical protein
VTVESCEASWIIVPLANPWTRSAESSRRYAVGLRLFAILLTSTGGKQIEYLWYWNYFYAAWVYPIC